VITNKMMMMMMMISSKRYEIWCQLVLAGL